jgi:hypothetical protein
MSWRDALLTQITTACDLGKVYSFERYDKSNSLQALQSIYTDNGKLAGGFLSLVQGHGETEGGMNAKQLSVELTVFAGWVDADESQLVFDTQLELLIDNSAQNTRLNDGWMFKTQNQTVGWQLFSHQPAMFAGVLVHMAKLRTTLYSLNC